MSSLWVVKKVKDGVTKWLDYDREEWSTVNASCRTSGEFWEGKMPCYGTVVEFVPRSELDEARRELERLRECVRVREATIWALGYCLEAESTMVWNRDQWITYAAVKEAGLSGAPSVTHPLEAQ